MKIAFSTFLAGAAFAAALVALPVISFASLHCDPRCDLHKDAVRNSQSP